MHNFQYVDTGMVGGRFRHNTRLSGTQAPLRKEGLQSMQYCSPLRQPSFFRPVFDGALACCGGGCSW